MRGKTFILRYVWKLSFYPCFISLKLSSFFLFHLLCSSPHNDDQLPFIELIPNFSWCVKKIKSSWWYEIILKKKSSDRNFTVESTSATPLLYSDDAMQIDNIDDIFYHMFLLCQSHSPWYIEKYVMEEKIISINAR